MLRYFIFYKPFQVLSQFSTEGNKKTLADFFTGLPKDVYPVGRLDYDSEGLLLLTNDKTLNQQLLHPSQKHTRTYWVQVEGSIDEEAIQKLCSGVSINVDGNAYKTLPASAEIFSAPPPVPERNPPIRFRKSVPDSWLQITLTEGKNRQVRKMTAAVDFPTLRLIRHSIGNINIDSLKPGENLELTRQNLDELMSGK